MFFSIVVSKWREKGGLPKSVLYHQKEHLRRAFLAYPNLPLRWKQLGYKIERLNLCAAKTLTGILLTLFPDVLERWFFFQFVACMECTKRNKEKFGSTVKVCRKWNQFVTSSAAFWQ